MCDDSNLGYGLLPLGSFSNLQNMINIKKWLSLRCECEEFSKSNKKHFISNFPWEYKVLPNILIFLGWVFIFLINHKKCTLLIFPREGFLWFIKRMKVQLRKIRTLGTTSHSHGKFLKGVFIDLLNYSYLHVKDIYFLYLSYFEDY